MFLNISYFLKKLLRILQKNHKVDNIKLVNVNSYILQNYGEGEGNL